jgi:hypothetical protein
MKLTHEYRMWLDIMIIAELYLEEMTDEEIQEQFGSDYYAELKKHIKKIKFWEEK